MTLDKAMKILSKDPAMAKVIRKVGKYKIKNIPNRYESLVRAIISQQLAGSAAKAITDRFVDSTPNRFPKPAQVLGFSNTKLRKIGLSERKIIYIKDLSLKIESKELKLQTISKLDDEEIIKQLVKIKGIGRWTAEMFLMFTLKRMDVLPVGDLGIRKGFRKMYQKSMTEKQMIHKAEKWRPYRSVATWYIWQSLYD